MPEPIEVDDWRDAPRGIYREHVGVSSVKVAVDYFVTTRGVEPLAVYFMTNTKTWRRKKTITYTVHCYTWIELP